MSLRGLTCIHGYAKQNNKHPLYKRWSQMKSRCYNQNDINYMSYGGRGISICKKWINNPIAFIEWALKHGWKNNLFLDREDNNGSYTSDNCRFVNITISNINKRKRKDNTSGFRGVSFNSNKGYWTGRVQYYKKRTELCRTNTAKEAAIIRDQFIIDNNLPHPLNFPKEII